MLMFPFLTGDPGRLLGRMPVGIVGGPENILLVLPTFFSVQALAPIADPGPAGTNGIREAPQGVAI
jgi:hypothetical protein